MLELQYSKRLERKNFVHKYTCRFIYQFIESILQVIRYDIIISNVKRFTDSDSLYNL